MNIQLASHPARDESASALPREVQLLLRREREVATIVYALGAATANDVLARLEVRLANASVRSMLNRLVAKGILMRSLAGRRFIYLPRLSASDSMRRALFQFADDYFGGSLEAAAQAMQEIVADQ